MIFQMKGRISITPSTISPHPPFSSFFRQKTSHLFFICFFSILILFSPKTAKADDPCTQSCTIYADESDRSKCVDAKIACLQDKIKDTQNEQSTLAREKVIVENNISLTQARIEQIKFDQVRTEKELLELDNRIENSSEKLSQLLSYLELQIITSYQKSRVSPLSFFLSSSLESNFTNFIAKRQYEGDLQEAITTSALKYQTDKDKYQNMAKEKAELQDELKGQADQMASQERRLEQQKQEKTNLIAQTQNDEKKYQSLLNSARTEIQSFARFASSQGGGTCLGSSVSSNDGWFYSQRDPRWCKQLIGLSDMTIGEVGCLLTSVSMIWGHYGFSTTPSSIGANSSYFFSSTAYMLTPPAPAGYTYKRYDYLNQSIIDSELAADRPVIVHVYTSNGYGGHFIVLKSGSNGSYVMHDPWNGPDLNFNSYYGINQIDSVRIFTQ